MEGMKQTKKQSVGNAEVIPLFGRDEMNLVEFPFGPITASTCKTFEVEHATFCHKLKREVTRELLITGSDAFGLPRPFDDQVLLGLKALTCEAGFKSKRVEFSRYRLCKTLGLPDDGRVYKRLEESLDRIQGTSLKFKNSWFDKSEKVYLSKNIHIIEEFQLCSRDSLDLARLESDRDVRSLCYIVWSDSMWKSFTDGFIKKVDLTTWRKISSKPRKEVALRLYRILDKRFYYGDSARFDIAKLCIGTLGLSKSYAPSQMKRVLQKAADWLAECGYLREVRFKSGKSGKPEALFIKANARERAGKRQKTDSKPTSPNPVLKQFDLLPPEKQEKLLAKALEHCKKSSPLLFEGFRRNDGQKGDAFEGYREQVIACYLEHLKKKQAKAA